MLEMKHVTKKFRKKEVLKGVSGLLEAGVYGLLGANGAGKTTLYRCLTGLYGVSQGEILWNGENIKKSKTYLSSIGYLPQKFEGLKELKVTEFLEYFGDMKGMGDSQLEEEIPQILSIVNLQEKANSRVGTLSGGMIRRLGIAQALLNEPKLLLFDEPTAGLDPEERLRFKNIVTQLPKDKIIIISTHIVEDIEAVCDKIIVMHQGNILGIFSMEELSNMAREKVFVLPESEIGVLEGNYRIIKEYQNKGTVMVRILSDEILNLESVEPTIEDGYLWMINQEEVWS